MRLLPQNLRRLWSSPSRDGCRRELATVWAHANMRAMEYFANKPQQAHYWEAVSSPQSKLWLNTPVLVSREEKSPPICIFSPTNSAELAQQAVVKSLLHLKYCILLRSSPTATLFKLLSWRKGCWVDSRDGTMLTDESCLLSWQQSRDSVSILGRFALDKRRSPGRAVSCEKP